MDDGFLTVPAVARSLRLGINSVCGLAAKGELRASGWPLKVRRTDLEEYVQRARLRAGQLGRTCNQYRR